jgi:Zn-dependent protease
LKALLMLLFAGKAGKVLLSAGTMLISVVIYGKLYGWKYGVGFVLLLLVHEMGHYVAARQRQLSVGLPTFIPFVGAWINLKNQGLSSETQAFVGMAGPLLGSTGAFVVYLVALEYQLPWLLAIAYAGFILNLFNLIPIVPLDGGHIVAVISPKIWLIGLPMLVGLYIWQPSPLLIVIGILAIPKAWAAFTNRIPVAPGLLLATNSLKARYAAEYLGLVGFLTVMTFELHSQLQ